MAAAHANELRDFLRRARRAVAPETLGLSSHGVRRTRGLRREDIAEAIGISEGWYARFEAGKARVSTGALARIAETLQLDAEARRTLIRLARPELLDVSENSVAQRFSGLGAAVSELREFVRTCSGASGIRDISDAATRAIHRMCGPATLAYMRACEPEGGDLIVVGAHGPAAQTLDGHRQPSSSVAYAMQHFVRGEAFCEPDLRVSPNSDLRARVERMGVRAYYTQPIFGPRGLELMLGIATSEPGAPPPAHVGALEAAAAIVELCLRR